MTLSPTAQLLLNSYDQLQPVQLEDMPVNLTLTDAAAIQAEIVAARSERGETPLGYKIGFTNRTIWERYGVHHPIWAPIYDTTLTLLSEDAISEVTASQFLEPRLEPEIVIKLKQTPQNADPSTVAQAIDWIAHGFEIVQSAFPGWQFTGAQSFAAQALHGALIVGPRFEPKQFGQVALLPETLSRLSLRLYNNSQTDPIDQGVGSNVLDGPIHALCHLVTAMLEQGKNLDANAIITTGTLTDAQPILAGQRWESKLENAGPLCGLTLTVKQ